MKLNDPERFARELQGDFSEIDSYLRRQYFEMAVVLLGLVACVVAVVFL